MVHIPAYRTGRDESTENESTEQEDDEWSEQEVIDKWVSNVEKPDPEVPLNWETLQEVKLFLLNPDWSEGYSYSIWVVHTNGVEFPVFTSGDIGAWNTSVVGGGEQWIEPTEQFWDQLYLTLHEYLLFPYENFNVYNDIDDGRFPTSFPDDLSELEQWAIENIISYVCAHCMSENYDSVSYEALWIIQQSLNHIQNES